MATDLEPESAGAPARLWSADGKAVQLCSISIRWEPLTALAGTGATRSPCSARLQ